MLGLSEFPILKMRGLAAPFLKSSLFFDFSIFAPLAEGIYDYAIVYSIYVNFVL
jgi:hypothetical protein